MSMFPYYAHYFTLTYWVYINIKAHLTPATNLLIANSIYTNSDSRTLRNPGFIQSLSSVFVLIWWIIVGLLFQTISWFIWAPITLICLVGSMFIDHKLIPLNSWVFVGLIVIAPLLYSSSSFWEIYIILEVLSYGVLAAVCLQQTELTSNFSSDQTTQFNINILYLIIYNFFSTILLLVAFIVFDHSNLISGSFLIPGSMVSGVEAQLGAFAIIFGTSIKLGIGPWAIITFSVYQAFSKPTLIFYICLVVGVLSPMLVSMSMMLFSKECGNLSSSIMQLICLIALASSVLITVVVNIDYSVKSFKKMLCYSGGLVNFYIILIVWI